VEYEWSMNKICKEDKAMMHEKSERKREGVYTATHRMRGMRGSQDSNGRTAALWQLL
jgi:hypothetical protein